MDMIKELSKHTGEVRLLTVDEARVRLLALGAAHHKDDKLDLAESVYNDLLNEKWYERAAYSFKLLRGKDV